MYLRVLVLKCLLCAPAGCCYQCETPLSNGALNVLKSRLCQRCLFTSRKVRCYFCRRDKDLMDPDTYWIPKACDECRSLHAELVPMCTICHDLHHKFICRSCCAQGWQGRCFRCCKKWSQRTKSQFCIDCYNVLFVYPDVERKEVAAEVFRSFPPGEWYLR